MNSVSHLIFQKIIHHALAFNPSPPFEQVGDHRNLKVGFPRTIVAGMPGMEVAFIHDVQPERLQTLCQILGDTLLHGWGHAPC